MKNLLVLLLLAPAFLLAGQALETNSFKDIEAKALELGKKHGNDNVLVVLDIDNTILTMPQELGSDQWFTWQYDNCIKKASKGNFCTTNKMGELLDLQGKLFSLSNMVPTEEVAPKIVKSLQTKGFKVMLLTSRGPGFRDATERELKRNGYSMKKNAIGPIGGYPGTYLPYEMKSLNRSGITKEEATVAKLRKARKISFMNGVMMTAGLNKGIMLKTILTKTNTKFKGIVFADDHIKHTKRMQAIMGNKEGVDLITFRYGKIDSSVKAFKASDKKKVIKAYNSLQSTMGTIFK